MLSGELRPRAGQRHGHAAGLARQSLDEGVAVGTGLVVCDAQDADGAVECPHGDDGVQVLELGKVLKVQVVPHADDREDGDRNVEELERLVPGVSNGADGMDAEEDECASRLRKQC